jgi:DNA-binding response OmpR family regulator
MTTTNPSTVWVLEDDPGCAFVYEMVLSKSYDLHVFSCLAELRAAVDDGSSPALLVADLRLPDGSLGDALGSGWARQLLPQVPLIVVSSVAEASALRKYFSLGVVDYLVKPFHQNELLVKVERWLEKSQAAARGIRVDPRSMCIFNGEAGSPLLTAREMQIVTLLHSEMPRPMTRQSLEQKLWADARVSSKTLDVHMFNIRRKLAQIHLAIACDKGGFRLEPDAARKGDA